MALALVAIAGGTVVSYAYDDEAPLVARLGYGAATGLVAMAAIGFAFANLVGIEPATLLATIALALPLVALGRADVRGRVADDIRASGATVLAAVRTRSPAAIGQLVYLVVLVALLWLVFNQVIVERDGGLSTGYVNNLGDMPFHVGVTSSFAYGQNFPPEDPTFAGTGFAYPYLSDFLTAMFVVAGASMTSAFLVGNVALGLAFVAVLYRFTRVLTGDRLAGFIAPVVVLLSGGLGWTRLVQDARESDVGIVGLLGALTHDYTISPEGPLRWGNAITTLLVTQRSLLMGLPIALLAFILLWRLVHVDADRDPDAGESGPRPARVTPTRLALAAGLLAGSLPLVHAHSFIVVMGSAFFIGLFFRQWREGRWRPWLLFVLVALAVALPQVWWSTRDSVANAGTFFGFEIGWDHGQENVVWFWFINTGLFIPLAAAAVVWLVRDRIESRELLLFSAAFLVWFIVPNVMKLAPWVWDNIKVLFYWFVGFVPLVAFLLARLLRAGGSLRLAGLGALLALTLAGGLDVWRAVSGQTVYGEFDRDAITLAARIREATPPRARMLNAPIWNATVFLTGRQPLLGYTGHVFSRGLPYADREADIALIYAGDPSADDLLERYAIEYIVVSPIERSHLAVNDAYFERFTRIAEAGEYVLYEVPRP